MITEIDKICILNTSREYLVSLQANVSGGKWTNLAQPGADKKNKKNVYSNQLFYTHKNFQHFIIFVYSKDYLLYEINIQKICILWSKLRQKINIQKSPNTLLTFIFYSLENVYIVRKHVDASFLFLV